MSHDDKNNSGGSSEGGNFWTSYSDLLLGLSVIFLVLFFFATVRAGVEQLKAKKVTQDSALLLKGKVPDSEKAASQKKTDLLRQNLDDLAEKKVQILKTAENVEQLVKSLESQQTVVEQVIKDQVEKAAALAVAHENNQELERQNKSAQAAKLHQDKVLAEREASLQALDSQIRAMEQKKIEMELESRKLAQNLQTREQELALQKSKAEQSIQSLEKESLARAQVNAKFEAAERDRAALAKNLSERDSILEQKIAELDKSQSAAEQEKATRERLQASDAASRAEVSRLSSSMSVLQAASGKNETELAQLKAQAVERDSALAGLKSKLSDTERKLTAVSANTAGLETGLAQLKAQMGEKDSALAGLKGKLSDTERKLGAASASNAGLEAALANGKSELERALSSGSNWQKKASTCEDRVAELENNTQKQGRKLANLDSQLQKAKTELKVVEAQRRSIASDLASSLKSAGVGASVNADSGVLTVDMDIFQFKNGSASLSAHAKQKLKEMIPAYARSVFGNAANAGRIARVDITGHASPRYRKHYVDPKGADRKARKYNEDLSARRARTIVAYIFGDEIGAYPYKFDMKMLTQGSGKGHNAPILAARGAKTEEACGIYDCAKSRRVEISFILKGDEPPRKDETPRQPASEQYGPAEAPKGASL